MRKKSTTVKKRETNTDTAITRLVDEIGRNKEIKDGADKALKEKRLELEEIDNERLEFFGKEYKVTFVEKDGRRTLDKDLLIDSLVSEGLVRSAAIRLIENCHKVGKSYREMTVKKLGK